MNSTKILILSAPSGSGKTTILKRLLEKYDKLQFSISATTRNVRGKEKDGIDYYFLSVEEFKNKINNNEFLEWEQVYENTYYGTLMSEIERIANNGCVPVFDVDVVGGANIKKKYGDNALALFIQPPSIQELQTRLEIRATDSPEKIKERVDKAAEELKYSDKFDHIIINDDLEEAVKQADKLLNDFIDL